MTDRAEPSGQRALHPFRDVGVVVLVVVAIAGGGLWFSGNTTRKGEAARYAGDRSCRECHPGETASHSRSGHARTLRDASVVKLDGVSADDPEIPDVSWRYTLREGKLNVERSEKGKTDAERYLIEYAFGSGHHATTFVTMQDRDPAHPSILEHRLTTFAHQEKPGLTPGHSLAGHASGNTPHGRIHNSFNTLACFGCHTTLISDQGADRLDTSTMIPNIGCERCHGPAATHVEQSRRGVSGSSRPLEFGSGRWTTARLMEFCGACHRLPDMVKPADIRVDNPAIVRHQPVGLMQSACYAKSKGVLNCVTCHDPHAAASTDHSSYERVCLSCHEAPSKACPASARTGCVECHMPRRDIARGMKMTDHWIQTRPEAAKR